MTVQKIHMMPLFLITCLLTGSCGPDPEAGRGAKDTGVTVFDPYPAGISPGVILVSFDTLRADGLGCYGNPLPVSPVLDRLAARSIQYMSEIVQLPGTLPSHMSIFTSLYPRQHTVYPPDAVLPANIQTAAEFFKLAGFTTAGFTEGGYVKGQYGFSRGFDHFRDDLNGWDNTLRTGLNFLSTLQPDEPFFLFMHTYQTHDPYYPPEPYKRFYLSGQYTPSFDPTGPNLVAANQGRLPASGSDAEYFRKLYDAEIRFTDAVCSELIGHLTGSSLWDRILLIMTSDHGEEFLEHGKFVHEQLYDPLVRVPLLVKIPVQPEKSLVPDLLESIDILPGMLQYARIPIPDQVQGQSMFRFLSGRRPAGTAYTESFATSGATLQQIRNGRHMKFILQQAGLPGRNDMLLEREGTIQVKGNRPELILLAYHQPRNISIFHKGALIHECRVDLKWSTCIVEIPGADPGSLHELRIVSDGCDTPASISRSRDNRCLSLVVSRTDTVPLIRAEFYDVTGDPAETVNLLTDTMTKQSDQEYIAREWGVELDRKMEGMKPMGPAGKLKLEIREIDALKAMGYLQ
ncbi:sulfatase [bacterium]|nr:sulfatase [candidate division CSSED10-310 bacterium]